LQQKEDSVKNGVSTVTLDDLIKAALTGQPYNQQRLGNEAQRYARHLSKAKAPDLPDDLHEDVFQQAFVELLHAGPAGLAIRSGKALLRRAVLAAIRTVRATSAPPGQRTRNTQEMHHPQVAAEDVGRVADTRTIERCTVANGADVFIDFDLFADRRAELEMQRVEDAIDVGAFLAQAPEQVAWALRLIHLNDEPVEAVAAQAQISRFALNRRFTAFYDFVRAAA
jgi:DNA-directed RNA polymerase specialized sigma24 family protein